METAEMVLRMVLVGLGATLIMDLSALIQARVFGSASLDYRLVGRWLGHMPKGQFRHASIVAAHPTWHESLIGWGFHYVTGVVFAMVLLAVQGQAWLCSPSLMPALLTGLISVLAPFCIMQPAFGFGFAAAKTPTPNRARRRSLLAHLTFGAGLFVAGWLLIQLFPASVCLRQG